MSVTPRIAAFKAALSSRKSADQIFSEFFDDDRCWILEDSNTNISYRNLRASLAQRVRLQPADIRIVGSARLGFSLNPKKPFAPFAFSNSDVDIVVCSKKLFSKIWDDLLRIDYQARIQSGKKSDEFRALQKGNAFRKFFFLDDTLTRLSKAVREVRQQLDAVSKGFSDITSLKVAANYRLYMSEAASIQYHVAGIEHLRKLK